MYFRRNRRGLYRILPVPKGILRVGGITDHLSRENRPNTGK